MERSLTCVPVSKAQMLADYQPDLFHRPKMYLHKKAFRPKTHQKQLKWIKKSFLQFDLKIILAWETCWAGFSSSALYPLCAPTTAALISIMKIACNTFKLVLLLSLCVIECAHVNEGYYVMIFCRINIKERQLEDSKYELRAVEDKNLRHKERVSSF